MIWFVMVGVALERPPRIDQFRHYTIEADTWLDAQLVAIQWAHHKSEMAVWAGIEEEVPFLPEELYR